MFFSATLVGRVGDGSGDIRSWSLVLFGKIIFVMEIGCLRAWESF